MLKNKKIVDDFNEKIDDFWLMYCDFIKKTNLFNLFIDEICDENELITIDDDDDNSNDMIISIKSLKSKLIISILMTKIAA